MNNRLHPALCPECGGPAYRMEGQPIEPCAQCVEWARLDGWAEKHQMGTLYFTSQAEVEAWLKKHTDPNLYILDAAQAQANHHDRPCYTYTNKEGHQDLTLRLGALDDYATIISIHRPEKEKVKNGKK